jgi:hypothetical protein
MFFSFAYLAFCAVLKLLADGDATSSPKTSN